MIYCDIRAELLTRYELWDDLIEATNTGALDWSSVALEQEQKAYTLGLAYAAKNNQAKLAEQVEALKKLTSPGAKSALAELSGLQLLSRSEIGPAFEQFAKATTMRPEALARAHLAARNYGFAESHARQAVAKNPNQVPPLAALVEILQAVGKEKEAREAYRNTRVVGPLGRPRPTRLPPPRADRRPLEGRQDLDRLGQSAGEQPRHRRDCYRQDRAEHARALGLEPFSSRANLQGRHQWNPLEPGQPERQKRPRSLLPRR